MVKHEQQNETSELSQVEERFTTQPQIQHSTDDARPRAEVIEEILNHLQMDDCDPIVLHGEEGVGKTWIAREVSKHAISKQIVDVTLWIDEAYVYIEQLTEVVKNVAYQLSIKQDMPGAEYYFENGNGMNYLSQIESLKQTLKGKKYLVVFDSICSWDSASMMCNDAFWMNKLSDSENYSPKILVTARYHYIAEYVPSSPVALELKHLTLLESKSLLQRNWYGNHIPLLNEDGFEDVPLLNEDDLEDIVKRCKYLPGAIVFMGNVLQYALNNAPDDLYRNLAIAEAKKESNMFWVLGYEKFMGNVTLRRCLWRSWMALDESFNRMNYNDLILYWIMEGLFKNATSLEKAYNLGHSVLIDLVDAGLVGEREAGDVALEFAGLNFGMHLREVLCDDTDDINNLPNLFNGHNNVKRMDGSIAGFQGESGEAKLKTLVVKGNDNSKVDLIDIFRKSFGFKELKNLCVSHVQELNLSLFDECDKLQVLILRDCHSVTHIESITAHRCLAVLEISECSSFEVPEGLFALLKELKMLNLSGTKIKSLSSCLLPYNVQQVILQKCIYLESFPDITGYGRLRKLDLSGAKFDTLDNKPWGLENLGSLQELHLSETNIYEVPDLGELRGLEYLFLRKCPLLKRIGTLSTLCYLRVIDASGCSELDCFGEENLPSGGSLEKLDLSSTMVPKIPPLKSRLKHLCLKGCPQLKELPPIENAKLLRILDASDAIQLEKINCSLEEMLQLQELLLSNTKITTLPPLPSSKSLRKLILRGCESLLSLPDMFQLTSPLLVDIQGCNALQAVQPLHFPSNAVVLSDNP